MIFLLRINTAVRRRRWSLTIRNFFHEKKREDFLGNWFHGFLLFASWQEYIFRECRSVLHCRIFNDILTAMSNDWREYSNMYAMIDKAVLSHRCSKLIIGVYSTAVLLYSTVNFHKQTDDDCRELLIKMELPFAFCESPIYETVTGVQFVQLMAVASAIGMLDALIVTLVSCDQHFYNFSCVLTQYYYISCVLTQYY